jgi:PRTRC genetic system ThiF family protein
MTYKASFHEQRKNQVLVVGCGGTGGYVAEGLCRILPIEWEIILQDHDRVEDRNLCRQNFFQQDLGMFKSQALAERFSANYRRKIAYKITPFGVGYEIPNLSWSTTITIGCVDNAGARQAINNKGSYSSTWWIDSGNGHRSGQVLIGNTGADGIKGSFLRNSQIAERLPKPSVQLPGILAPTSEPAPSCAAAVQDEEQSPIINQAMAMLVLQAVHQLITGNLTWMSAFIDLEAGSLSTTPIEPATVARICGVRVDTLFSDKERRVFSR